MILVEWAEEGDKFSDVVARLLADLWKTRMQAAPDLAKVSVKGDAHTIALLKARLPSDSAKEVRLAQ